MKRVQLLFMQMVIWRVFLRNWPRWEGAHHPKLTKLYEKQLHPYETKTQLLVTLASPQISFPLG
jgi:hypothetical protein